jgi:hypothetical protein
MSFSMKNNLFYLSLLSCALPSMAMQLQMPYIKHIPYANFVHLTDLHEEGADELLRKALYSSKPDYVVLRDVKNAIRQGADVKFPYEDGKTPLHKAFEWPDLTIAKVLVQACPSSVNFCDEQGNTMLCDAIEKKDTLAVEFLLDNKINIEQGMCPLKKVIDNARYNRPDARGGLSYWPTTEELVCIVGKASSSAAVKEAKKYLKTKPYSDHYDFYIGKPLSKVAAEKERANGSPSPKRKSKSSDSDSSPAKKRKGLNGENLSLSQEKEIIWREGKRHIKTPNRFNSSLTAEEVEKMRAKRLQLQRSHDSRRIKK